MPTTLIAGDASTGLPLLAHSRKEPELRWGYTGIGYNSRYPITVRMDERLGRHDPEPIVAEWWGHC